MESDLGAMFVSCLLLCLFLPETGDLLFNGGSRNLDLDLVGGPPPGSSVGGHIAFALDGRLASAAVEVGSEARVRGETVCVLGEEVVELLFDITLLQTIKAGCFVSTAPMKGIVQRLGNPKRDESQQRSQVREAGCGTQARGSFRPLSVPGEVHSRSGKAGRHRMSFGADAIPKTCLLA